METSQLSLLVSSVTPVVPTPTLLLPSAEAQTKQTTKQPPESVRDGNAGGFRKYTLFGQIGARRMMHGRGVHGAAALAAVGLAGRADASA